MDFGTIFILLWALGRELWAFEPAWIPEKIAGSIRDSQLASKAISYRFFPQNQGQIRWSIQPGVELNSWTGTNVDISASASDSTPIWTLAISAGKEDAEGFSYLIEPRVAGWADKVKASTGGKVEGFGTVFGIRLAGSYRLHPRWLLSGEVIPVLSGDNTFEKPSGELERQVIFQIGVLTITGEDRWMQFGITNSAGSSVATSMIAAPDSSAGFLIQGGVNF